MNRYEAIAAAWRDCLSDGQQGSLAALLDREPPAARVSGRWLALSKPGLEDRERWRWEPPAGAPEQVVFVKRYGAARWRMQFDRILRQSAGHSRAYWEYARAEELAAGCIAAPRAVGVIEEMRGPFEHRSVVLLTRVEGDPLDRAWLNCLRDAAPITQGAMRRDIVTRLARFVAAFHGTGLCHRDLYLCHIFGVIDPRGITPPRFAVIDLARTHRPRWFRSRWLIKDLAQLDASAQQAGATRGDRLRFLRTYLGLERGAARLGYYARQIVRKSEWILARDARKRAATALTPEAQATPP